MSTKKNTKVCPICGKKFEPQATNQAYCCIKCKRTAGNKKRNAARAKVAAKPVKVVKAVKEPAKKATTKKPVALKEKVALKKTHHVMPGDTVYFDKTFRPEQILIYALRLEAEAFRVIEKKIK